MGGQEELFGKKTEGWSPYQGAKLPELAPPPLDASARELALAAALTRAKEQLHELRTRIVRADSVAYLWMTVPRHSEGGTARTTEVDCGSLMRRILGADGDLSLRTALVEFERQRLAAVE